MTSPVAADLAIDRELASISESFRFLVDLDAVIGMRQLSRFDIRIDPGAGTLSFTFSP